MRFLVQASEKIGQNQRRGGFYALSGRMSGAKVLKENAFLFVFCPPFPPEKKYERTYKVHGPAFS